MASRRCAPDSLLSEGSPRTVGRSRLDRSVGSTGGGLALSLAALTAASLTSVALSVDAPMIKHAFDLSEVGVGAIASCVYIGAAASSATAGRLTDSWGAVSVLALALLLLALGEAGAAGAPSGGLFFAGAVLAGVGYGSVNPPTNVLSNPANMRRRALSMSVKQTGIPIGGILAGVLIPPLAATWGWRISLLLPVFLCLALPVAVARYRPNPKGLSDGEPNQAVRVTLKMPWAYSFGFFMGGVQVTIFSFLALYLTQDRGETTAAAGASLSLLLVGGLVGRPAWGWLSDLLHTNRVAVLQLTSLLAGASLLLLPLSGKAALVVVLPLIGLTSVGWNGAYLATVAEAADPRAVGIETGHALVLVNVGAVLFPLLFGSIVSVQGSWPLAWDVFGVVSLVPLLVLHFCRVRPPVSTGSSAS